MRLDLQFKIRSDPNLYRYLRENSHWYKELNRNPESITYMIEEMKNKYKLTTTDKINNFSERLNMIKNFIDILK